MTVQKMEETGHGEVIHDVKIDCYGQRLATASSDTTVKIIALSTDSALRLLATLSGHQGPVLQVAWAHPKFGSILASCSQEGRVIIWKEVNPNEWVEARVFHEHKSSINIISWAPHELGLCLACGSSDGSISVLIARSDGGWDTSKIDQAHSGGVTSLLWVPAVVPGPMLGSWLHDPLLKLASGGCDNTTRVWKLYNGTWKMECLPPPSVGLPIPKSMIASPTNEDLGLGAPNVGLPIPKSTIASPPHDDVSLGAPNVGLPNSMNASPPHEDGGLGAPNVGLPIPKSMVTSPPQDDPGSGKFKRNHWNVEEDKLLVRAWLNISKGATEEGNDPKTVSSWKQLTKYYEDNRKGVVARTWSQLKSRWTKVKFGVKKFAECCDQASQEVECEGEIDEVEIIARAHKLYRSQNDDRRFLLEHAWILLKDEPKWKAYVNMLGEEGCSKRMKGSESGVCTSSSNRDTLTSGEVGSSEVYDNRPAKKPAKSNGKSEEALTEELQAIKAAELKKAVAMEELARTKQMEVDMQIIYKDTSSMNEEQLQFHGQLVQRLKQKYLL